MPDGDDTGDWTDQTAHDPAFTLLELLAYTLVGTASVFAIRRWRRRRSIPGG